MFRRGISIFIHSIYSSMYLHYSINHVCSFSIFRKTSEVAWICHYSVIMAPIFALSALVLQGNESRQGAPSCHSLQRGILESPWIWNEPHCPMLSTFNQCWVLHKVIAFTVYFSPSSTFFTLDKKGFLKQWYFASTLTIHLTPSCLPLLLFLPPSLRSPFQSYSCGSESGGHPGGQEWLLHCHEWRGHALQLGKLLTCAVRTAARHQHAPFLTCTHTHVTVCCLSISHCSKASPPFHLCCIWELFRCAFVLLCSTFHPHFVVRKKNKKQPEHVLHLI